MKELRRKVLIPAFTLTEICEEADPGAVKRVIRQEGETFTYATRPIVNPMNGEKFNYNLFPTILDRYSVPWSLGTLYILSRIEAQTYPVMTTMHGLADDVGAYKEWLDDHDDPDELLLSFPKMKQRRPTYRYRGFLKQKVYAGEISPSTAKRRMSAVVALYRWMITEKFFKPAHDPWQESSFQLSFKNTQGFSVTKKVVSVDVRITAPKTDDPFDGRIQDGGKLRPLSEREQQWVMEAAEALDNGEMYLILLFMILTGARIQTATTLRIRHFTQEKVAFSQALVGDGEVFKLKVGTGTGIDTKFDKSMVLQVPRPLYELLRTYTLSERAKHRRTLAAGGDHADQYLFLTQQGNPYYTSKEETRRFDPELKRHHHKSGGTVRQFLKDHLIPFVQKHHHPNFTFRVHDLRATYGMNQTDIHMALVQKGSITLHKARNNVMALMGHASSTTTDLYLDFRKQLEVIDAAVNGYGDQVRAWIDGAMNNVGND